MNKGRSHALGMEIKMAKELLRVEHLSSKKKGFSLKDISFSIEPGYIYGLMGENGAGKSTLLKAIMEEKRKQEGRILLNGRTIGDNYASFMNDIGFVSEENQFFEERTGLQNAQILGILYDHFDMDVFKNTMEQLQVSYQKTFNKMSRGEQLKFQLAFAMAHKPKLYLLDEVTAGMDPVFRIDFFTMLHKIIEDETAAVLMTSHITSEVETKTDYVGIMENGKLIAWGESLEIIPQIKERRHV